MKKDFIDILNVRTSMCRPPCSTSHGINVKSVTGLLDLLKSKFKLFMVEYLK